MRVLHVAAEVYPLVKTGGLADVAAALPAALSTRGLDVRLLLPGLPDILQGLESIQTLAECGPAFGAARVTLRSGQLPGTGLPALVIDAPYLYDRPGNPYLDASGAGWADNHRRYALLGWVAAQIGAGGLDPAWRPDVVHGHDWHAALAAAYLAVRPGPRPATVYTIHNLAYQGLFEAEIFPELGLPAWTQAIEGLEFHGQISYMKAGLRFADRITTVSPTYAREILTPEAAWGLEGVIRQRSADLSGILNGVDYQVWDPAHDPLIASPYRPADRSGKQRCREALREELGLSPAAGRPLFCVVSRLTEQKGLDLVLESLPDLLRLGAQLVVLGSGDPRLEAAFSAAAAQFPGRIAARIGYDEALAHRVIAGSDVILVPSRFEPCGLTQLYGLRYGTLPLVRRCGGLADTVEDASDANITAGHATGIVFDEASPAALVAALERTLRLWQRQELWSAVVDQAMRRNFSWDAAAGQYHALYQQLQA